MTRMPETTIEPMRPRKGRRFRTMTPRNPRKRSERYRDVARRP